jgi:hypothetical protein
VMQFPLSKYCWGPWSILPLIDSIL